MEKYTSLTAEREICILRVADIQKQLGIGRDRAYALMRSAGFPSTRIGRTYFVTADNFQEWLNEYKYKCFLLQE